MQQAEGHSGLPRAALAARYGTLHLKHLISLCPVQSFKNNQTQLTHSMIPRGQVLHQVLRQALGLVYPKSQNGQLVCCSQKDMMVTERHRGRLSHDPSRRANEPLDVLTTALQL